jgi:nucleotide-binding universal stress UspA family protein
MNRFKNILYISKGISDETDALKQAISLARNNQARLTFLILMPELPDKLSDHLDRYQESITDNFNQFVQKTADQLGLNLNDIDHTLEISVGPAPAIKAIKYAITHDHDLIIKDSSSKPEGSKINSVELDLLRKSPCPVWICRPIDHHRDDIRVAVAIDPDNDHKAAENLSIDLLTLGHGLAKTGDGRLSVISAWDYEFEQYLLNNPWNPITKPEIDREVARIRTHHEEKLLTLINRAGLDPENLNIHHKRGNPTTVIPNFVEDQDIDILVMGTVARTGIPGFFIGNTSENIIQQLSCSLLTMKPKGFVCPITPY